MKTHLNTETFPGFWISNSLTFPIFFVLVSWFPKLFLFRYFQVSENFPTLLELIRLEVRFTDSYVLCDRKNRVIRSFPFLIRLSFLVRITRDKMLLRNKQRMFAKRLDMLFLAWTSVINTHIHASNLNSFFAINLYFT